MIKFGRNKEIKFVIIASSLLILFVIIIQFLYDIYEPGHDVHNLVRFTIIVIFTFLAFFVINAHVYLKIFFSLLLLLIASLSPKELPNLDVNLNKHELIYFGADPIGKQPFLESRTIIIAEMDYLVGSNVMKPSVLNKETIDLIIDNINYHFYWGKHIELFDGNIRANPRETKRVLIDPSQSFHHETMFNKENNDLIWKQFLNYFDDFDENEIIKIETRAYLDNKVSLIDCFLEKKFFREEILKQKKMNKIPTYITAPCLK